ncbi:uncharacterized protein SCHCODRAFT_02165702 [Schizophyllum commune H4-8]|uniref:uncharacterized protein n=1 Tax=Schizophyllum commune (strain H4-8 / FGSC 9210) TaxID=578458 RepID=UPI00215F647D|nr:uncharacterized protein SCHCODRAFT_02165702 [Schizophyllum commune H4-8]KAI5898470.1 hypothetical protein SCHCODRAFT_02165702 [Schizophyllum commune H4-8]
MGYWRRILRGSTLQACMGASCCLASQDCPQSVGRATERDGREWRFFRKSQHVACRVGFVAWTARCSEAIDYTSAVTAMQPVSASLLWSPVKPLEC